MKIDFQINDFIYTPTQTSHGGSGFYIRDTLAFKRRNDLLLNPPDTADFKSTFLEIVLPNKKHLIVGCIYRHPSSKITLEDFSKNYLDPILGIISAENKTCALVGGFNIDLLNTIEYVSYSGNITIQLADHLFQFVLLEGFFHDAHQTNQVTKKMNQNHKLCSFQ